MSPNAERPGGARLVAAGAATVLLYVAAGVAGSLFGVRPGLASPLNPAAAVALLSVLLYGGRMVPAVMLGSLWLHWPDLSAASVPRLRPAQSVELMAAFVIASGLQGWAGAAAMRRFTTRPTSLPGRGDVLRFFLVALACPLIGAVIGNAAAWATGRLSSSDAALHTLIGWTGDLYGILIFVPIGLAIVGRPRQAWLQRRVQVSVALLLATVAMGIGIRTVERWHEERRTSAFERDAGSAALLLAAQLRESLQALKALHGALSTSDATASADVPQAMSDWIGPGHLIALGWGPWLSRAQVPEFEESVRQTGMPRFHVFDVPAPRDGPRSTVVPIRSIEPMQGANRTLIGLNQMSPAPSRAAIEAAGQSDGPVASEGFELPQPGQSVRRPMGVVVFQAVARRQDADAGANTRATPLGVAFATFRPDDQVRAVEAGVAPYLMLCIFDVTAGQAPYRLAGGERCDGNRGPHYVHPVSYAGRRWELRIGSLTGALPDARAADIWLFALVGLGSTAILGGFLLVTTGRARRIETAVEERTKALRAEVAEREQAQTALRESEQRFRNILNNVPMGICYADLRGNVKLVNPRFCELIGRDEDELLTLNILDLTHPDDRSEDIRFSSLLIAGQIPMYRRQKRYLRGGDTLRVQATVTLLRDAAGTARRLVGVVEDVSEHLRLEEAERAREAAEASNRAKSEFLSRMSHELRTPLNAMLGFAQLLELDPRHPLNPTQQPWVTQIQRAGWHLLEMINDVLDLSRIESGNLRLQTETLNLIELIDASRSMVQADAERRGIAISRTIGPGASNIVGDATRVKQILTNLLSNAVKYNIDGGQVEVIAETMGDDSVAISVHDTGLGMTADQLGQLFQPFNRLGLEKSTLQGTGIGLVISQRLAELMGGSLRARSTAGVGSSFILRLPSESEPDTVRSGLNEVTGTSAAYHTRIVHYVEDNETNVEVMRGILAQRPQVALEVSITGLDALAAIRARRPHLILLDMHLPDINGLELLRHFKADPQLAAVPVVIVSADALAGQIEEAHAAGCAHYLTKPVNVGALLRLVDDLLEEMDTRYS